MTPEWYDDRANLALTARYMADRGDTVADVVYMLEKPWKFGDDFRRRLAATRRGMECPTCSGRGVWMDEACGDCEGVS